jgi:hypothetical protein
MNIRAGDPIPPPTLVELAVSRPAWVSVLGNGNSEFIGVKSSFDGLSVVLSKTSLTKVEGESQAIDPFEISEAEIRAGLKWAERFSVRLSGVDEDTAALFAEAKAGIKKIDDYATESVVDFLSEGTVTVAAMRQDDKLHTLILLARKTRSDRGQRGDETDFIVVADDRFVKAIESVGMEATTETLKANLQIVKSARDTGIWGA